MAHPVELEALLKRAKDILEASRRILCLQVDIINNINETVEQSRFTWIYYWRFMLCLMLLACRCEMIAADDATCSSADCTAIGERPWT